MRSNTDIRSTHRIWTIGRIVALLAIAVAVAGLAHIHSGHPAGWTAVPDGAHAGQLKLKPCTYPPTAARSSSRRTGLIRSRG